MLRMRFDPHQASSGVTKNSSSGLCVFVIDEDGRSSMQNLLRNLRMGAIRFKGSWHTALYRFPLPWTDTRWETEGVGFGRRSFHNVSVAAVLQPGGVWLW